MKDFWFGLYTAGICYLFFVFLAWALKNSAPQKREKRPKTDKKD